MKTVWKIVRRILLTAGLVVYILVALLNYSIVQSVAGVVAGQYFTKEWGGKLYIGALHVMPFDHLIADDLLWVSPTDDTLLVADRLSVSFERFPFRGDALELDKVLLRNAYYHLSTENHEINLKFVIDYFKSNKPSKKHGPFTVKANELVLDNVHYKMDLPDHRSKVYPYGVQIPHMEFYGIDAKIKDITVVKDDVRCKIVRMSTRERSGFELKRLSARIHSSPYEIMAQELDLETGESHIVADARLTFKGWKGIKGYVSTVQQEVELKEGTRVSMHDVAYWAPVLWGIDAVVEATGMAHGTVDSIATDMTVTWGTRSMALVNGTVRGLPKIDTTEFDIVVNRLVTNREDMEPLLGLTTLDATTERLLAAASDISLQAQVLGGIKNHALARVSMDCGIGELFVDASLQRTPQGYRMGFATNSNSMDLSALQTEWVSEAGFDLKMDGMWRGDFKKLNQWDKRLGMMIDGRVKNCIVKGCHLTDMQLGGELKNGQLRFQAESADSLADLTLTASANLKDSVKRYALDADIRNLDLKVLPHPFGSRIALQAHGNSLEELTGELQASATRYGHLEVPHISLTVESDRHGKEIELVSDLADATVRGHFAYGDLPLMLKHFGERYLPSMFNRRSMTAIVNDIAEDVMSSIADNTMRFRLKWKDDGNVLKEWLEDVSIAPGTVVDGSYNYGEQLKVVVRSDSMSVGSVRLENMGIVGHPIGDKYTLQIEAQSLNIGKIELLERVSLTANCSPELGTVELKWGSNSDAIRGDLMVGLDGNNLTVIKPWFYVGETRWELSADRIVIDNKPRFSLEADGLTVASNEQQIKGHLFLKGLPNDCVELTFDKFDLDLLSSVLLQDSPLEVAGDINGRFSLYGLAQTPYFNANLSIDSCKVNRQALGRMNLRSQWDAERNLLQMQLLNRQLRARGGIGLGKKDPDLDFSVDFNNLELAVAEPLLAAFSSHFQGQLQGSFDIGGTVAHPLFVGEAEVENGALKIDITDVTYHFADSIQFSNNTIILDNFEIEDPLGNKAIANGTIKLTDEKELEIDLGLTADNLLVLNRKEGDDFYGRLLAAAEARVSGTTDMLDIDVTARTNPGCELTIPVNRQQRVKAQNYITFVNGQESTVTHTRDEESKKKRDYNLELDLAITNDAKINLPMDFQEVDVNVGATGSGDLHLGLNGSNPAQMMGSYEITSGTMKVGLLSVYEKRFTIENGSSLNFQGNVPDARFDLKAVYSQRVNMSTLTGSLSSVDNTQKYLQVENVIAIAGTLREPKISFDIRLPNADQSVEEEVFAYIDRSNELDMLNQTISLLISGSFYNVNSDSQTGSNPLDIVTSFVGNSLTDMVQFVDVNIDFRSATEVTKEQLDVNISKDWGRWYLESTLGYGGESRDLEASTVNGAIIDALIGYRLTPLFHLFAYNRTNTNDYTRIDLPYKQGAGLKLTKDFDSWSELFGKKRKKK